jgi:hypothetical protein
VIMSDCGRVRILGLRIVDGAVVKMGRIGRTA